MARYSRCVPASNSRASRGSNSTASLGDRASTVLKNISVRTWALVQTLVEKVIFLLWFPLLLIFKVLILLTAVALYVAYLVYALGYVVFRRATGADEDVNVKVGLNSRVWSLLAPTPANHKNQTDFFFRITIPCSKFFLSLNTNYSWKFTRDNNVKSS